MTLLCKCMRVDCPHPHYSDLSGWPDDDYEEEVDACGADDVDQKEDKTWPPKSMETK
jgi:hypothetical protein